MVDIYSFSNGNSVDKRRVNWQRIAKFLVSQGFDIKPADWEPIIHLAKGAALELIRRLYTHLNKGLLINDTSVKKVEKVPYYMKPTATLLMKNTELNRITDNDLRFESKVDVLKNYYARSRFEKQTLGLEEFIAKQSSKLAKRNASQLTSKRRENRRGRKSANTQGLQNKIPMIEVNNGDGNNQKSNVQDNTSKNTITVEHLNKLVIESLGKLR